MYECHFFDNSSGDRDMCQYGRHGVHSPGIHFIMASTGVSLLYLTVRSWEFLGMS